MSHRSGNLGKIPNESPVKTDVIEKTLNTFDSRGMRDCSQLINFVHKFLGTVKFGNDHVAKIMGYGDYTIGIVMISRVYFVEGLGHNLFSVGISQETSVARSPQHNGVVERRGIANLALQGCSRSGYRLFPLVLGLVAGRGWEKMCIAFRQEKGVTVYSVLKLTGNMGESFRDMARLVIVVKKD
nr:integrase, catalytic region, zinc finger, CCHC-type, peptidase aspartic, catalytic [Tanacetum cinerariifolium]